MHWSWPQYTLITIYAIAALFTAHQHGRPKKDNENIFTTLIAIAINVILLIEGGFF